MPAQALLLLNPGSGGANAALDAGLEYLSGQGISVIHKQAEDPGQVAELIRHYRDQIDRVIVGGGDGSMNMALPGLLENDLPLGVLPMGTANDFARTLGLSENLEAACRVIVSGRRQRIDVGRVNDHPFLNVAHVGLAVEVARRSDGDLKQRLGALAYPYAAWMAFRTRRSFNVSISCDGRTQTLRAVQVSVGNGRFYGGGIPIAEDADIDDGRLDIYAIPAARGGRLMAILPALRAGQTRQAEDIVTQQGESVSIHTRRPKTVSVDGEEMTHTPARFEVLRGALEVFVRAHG